MSKGTAVFPPVMQNGVVREPKIAEVVAVLHMLDRYFLAHQYEAGWSDDTIAEKTGIPRVLVQKIRLESPAHGEIAAHPEIARIRKDILASRAQLDDMEQRLTRVEQGNRQVGR